jgi:CTP synthase
MTPTDNREKKKIQASAGARRGGGPRARKYVFVTGGVMSGLGKGITTSSLAKLLQLSGLAVTCMKVDPYLNFDAGTMNPIAHGEVFVTDDGGETDMDIGTYERFLNEDLSRENNITTGQIYRHVIEDERNGKYLGKCVQIIPHVTDEIKRRIRELGRKARVDVVVVECGGTVGDIESQPFIEAFRQMRLEDGQSNTFFIHVTLAPQIDVVGEMKTKPTQHSVQELRRIGIQPDLVIVRGTRALPRSAREKIALFTSVPSESVISNPDVDTIYHVPEALYNEGILKPVFRHLDMKGRRTNLTNWRSVAGRFVDFEKTATIAIVGKYVALPDAYVSVNQALQHAAAVNNVGLDIRWIESEMLEGGERTALEALSSVDGIVLPQGYGKRGTEGKILVASFAREKKIPFLGLCFGFQLSIVSFARNVLGLKFANSTEIDQGTPDPVVDLLPEQKGRVRRLRDDEDKGKAQAQVRAEPGIHPAPRGARDALLRLQRRGQEGGDTGGGRPSVLPRHTVPSGVSQQTRGPRTRVHLICEGGRGAHRLRPRRQGTADRLASHRYSSRCLLLPARRSWRCRLHTPSLS